MPEINDRMTTTLEALRSDVERTPLADSLAVRRRGDQRTRRQAIGASLVVVALVAGAVGYLTGGLTGGNEGLPPATGGPTASTTVETALDLAADPSLRESDVGPIGPYEMLRSPDPAEALGQKQLRCMPDPTELGASQTIGSYYYSDLDGAFTEYVLRFNSTPDAAAASAAFGQAFENCPEGDPADATVVDRQPEAVSSIGVHASRLSTPTVASEPHYYELGLSRDRNVLVILQWTSMGNPIGEGAGDWVWTAELMQSALGRAIA